MKIENYSQYESYYTKNACSIVSMINVFKFRYGITVAPSFVIKLAIFFDKLGVFSITKGATFTIIDKAMAYYLSIKLGLSFKVVTKQISSLSSDDKNTYQCGLPSYSTARIKKMSAGGEITKADIDYAMTFTGGSGHAAAFDMSAGGYYIDSYGKRSVKMSYETLQYAQQKGFFWNNIRAIVPADSFTEQVCKETIQLFINEKKNQLEGYITSEKNRGNKYIDKAVELYMYGRQEGNS